MDQHDYWFRRKRFGWGLEPRNRKGWLATAIFAIVEAGGVFALKRISARSQPRIIVAWAFVWLALFLRVILHRAEPKWWVLSEP
jgi:hypothetical protein